MELRRLLMDSRIELRAGETTDPFGSGGPGMLTGTALTFNRESRDLGGWTEVIDPGTFAASLDRGDRVMCRAEHDSRMLLGTTDAGTLRVWGDETGIYYENALPDTSAGRDVAVLAERGDYQFSSFAFYETAGHWEPYELTGGRLVWRVTEGILVDVAPVADPAYFSSSTEMAGRDLVAARALLTAQDGRPEPPISGDADVALRSIRARAARLRLVNLREGTSA